MATKSKKAEVEESARIEEPVQKYPHMSELFEMTFSTDNPDQFVGVRRGLKFGTIEFYPKQAE